MEAIKKIQKEIKRVMPSISMNNNYSGAYRDGLEFSLKAIKVDVPFILKIIEDIKFVKTGGAYEDRENLTITTSKKAQTIKITGFYDGNVNLDVEIEMNINEFLDKLKIINIKGKDMTIIKMQREIVNVNREVFGDQDSVNFLLGINEEVGELSHFQLKGTQGIQYSEEEIVKKKKGCVGDIMMFLLLYCDKEDIDIIMEMDSSLEKSKKELPKYKERLKETRDMKSYMDPI